MSNLLRWNPKHAEYVIYSNERQRCEVAGLTRSTSTRGPAGQTAWFTKEAYAALEFFEDGDAAAKQNLAVLKKNYDASFALDGPDNFVVPPGLSLMPYQRGGVDFIVKRTNTLIGDVPGLGKTIQAIVAVNSMGAKRTLVVCPATIRLNWQREILKWAVPKPPTPRHVQVVLSSKNGINPHVPWIVISYELTRNPIIHQCLFDLGFDCLIIDEAHMLKQPDAERTRSLFGGGKNQFTATPIARNCKRIVALTGTPTPNRPREAFTLAQALCHEAIDWMSYDHFCYRFNPSAKGETQRDDGSTAIYRIEKQGRLMELQARLRTNFMIRRQKEEVLKDLPDKRYELAYIEPNGLISDVLRREKLLHFTYEDLKDPMSELFGMISTLRREMGEAKVPRIIEHVKTLFEVMEVPKIVLFCHHRSVMDMLAQAFAGFGIVSVRGGMSTTAKQKAIDEFINNPRCRIWMGQMDAAGFGIDGLQKVCNYVVVAEPAWTPGTNEQAIDRCHRIGQHANVVAQFLVVEGSLDERVLALVLDKVQTIHATLDQKVG